MLDGVKIKRRAFVKDLHYVKTRLKPCVRKFKIHNVIGKVTKDEVKEFLQKIGTDVEVENDMVKPNPDHPKAAMIMKFFEKMDEENRGLTDSYVCKVFSKEPMPSNIPVSGKLLTISGPGINPQCNWCFQTNHFERFCPRKLSGRIKLPIAEYEKQLIEDFNAPEDEDQQDDIEEIEAINDCRPINANRFDNDLEIEETESNDNAINNSEDFPPPAATFNNTSTPNTQIGGIRRQRTSTSPTNQVDENLQKRGRFTDPKAYPPLPPRPIDRNKTR